MEIFTQLLEKNKLSLTLFSFAILANIFILLDIFPLRQIFGFAYLTFVPGMLLLKLLGIERLNLTEIILFSVGLSICIIVSVGLFLNQLLPLIGIIAPLCHIPLLLSFDFIIIILTFIDLKKGKNQQKYLKDIKIPFHVFPLLFLPFLGIAGAMLIGMDLSLNIVNLILVIVICFTILKVSTLKKVISPYIFPLALFVITSAFLLATLFTTNNIVGYDVYQEFYVYQITNNRKTWGSLSTYDIETQEANEMLSVTILPTIYSQILRTEEAVTFKVLYIFLLSLVPMGLYILYLKQENMSEKDSFWAASYFIAYLFSLVSFAGTAPAVKMTVALFFYVLIIYLIFCKRNGGREKILILAFTWSLIVSHYTTTYFLVFVIFVIWSILLLKGKVNSKVSSRYVLLVISLTFLWYIYAGKAATFDNLVHRISLLLNNFFSNFLDPRSRTSMVLRGLGLEQHPSLIHRISSFTFYCTELLILIGFLTVIVKRKKLGFKLEYTAFSFANMVILSLNLIVPYFAAQFRVERFYLIALIGLSPLFVIGGRTISTFFDKSANKSKGIALILIVLIPFILFQTGFMFEITQDTAWALPFSMHRMNETRLYDVVTSNREVFAAYWLRENGNLSGTLIYADYISISHVLLSYGLFDYENTSEMSALLYREENRNTLIFLRCLNEEKGIIILSQGAWRVDKISPFILNLNKVYSNGGCSVYKSKN